VAAARRVGAVHANASMPDVLALTSPPRRGPAASRPRRSPDVPYMPDVAHPSTCPATRHLAGSGGDNPRDQLAARRRRCGRGRRSLL